MSGNTQAEPSPVAKTGSAATQFTGLDRDQLTKIAENLERAYQIGLHRDSAKYTSDPVLLRTNELFTRLVSMYTSLFTTFWDDFIVANKAITGTTKAEQQRQLAVIYVTAWFHDLYVSNRECVKTISGAMFKKHYEHQLAYVAGKFDPFLASLNTIIRPTHIVNGLLDAVYYPYICEEPDFEAEDSNYFNINNAEYNPVALLAILSVFDAPSNDFSTVPLNTNTYGRPGWLFDYNDGEAYAFFPREGNYSQVDLIHTQILGIPCSPRLGPCDIDDWQPFRNNSRPSNYLTAPYRRLTPRKFYGSAEYTTYQFVEYVYDLTELIPSLTFGSSSSGAAEASSSTLQLSSPRGQTTSDTLTVLQRETRQEDTPMVDIYPEEVTLYMYRVVDWCYHERVTHAQLSQVANKAFKNMIFKGAQSDD